MKTHKLLTVIVFLLAIGSAFATHFLTPVDGYTQKVDVPGQVEDCKWRGQCDGTNEICTATFDHDGNPLTDEITRNLYSMPSGNCGTLLYKN